MERQLHDAADNRNQVEEAQLVLQRSPQTRREATLAFLSWAWEDSANRPVIRKAIEGVQSKLPAIEVALLALVALYGMYLIVTKGRRKEKRVVTRKPDGSFEETHEIEYHSPDGPLSVVTKLFKKPLP